MKEKRGGGEVKVRSEEAGRTRMRLKEGIKPSCDEDIHPCSQCVVVVDSFVCCISHLSIEGGEVRT